MSDKRSDGDSDGASSTGRTLDERISDIMTLLWRFGLRDKHADLKAYVAEHNALRDAAKENAP